METGCRHGLATPHLGRRVVSPGSRGRRKKPNGLPNEESRINAAERPVFHLGIIISQPAVAENGAIEHLRPLPKRLTHV